MASPIPRTLAEPAAPAGPRAKSHWSKESTPRDSAKGAVPLQEVVCNLSLTRLPAVYARPWRTRSGCARDGEEALACTEPTD